MIKFIKYTLFFLVVLVTVAAISAIYMGARVHYADNPLAQNWHNEGPYIFFKDENEVEVSYISDGKDGGYIAANKLISVESLKFATSYFPIDNSSFDFEITTDFSHPASIYNDDNKILAISDIESNYKTFRDFLINSKVIDSDLRWRFGSGHLVLVGDFIDRGYFTTQVLWFIYKLEQEAKKQGGQVHYIIGNHELKMMHGNYSAADPKYQQVASILGKKESDLYGVNSLIGKWLASKNAIEMINGHLFVHGGIHPDLAKSEQTIDEMNQVIRASYYDVFEPDTSSNHDRLLLSKQTGPCWYRGYFKEGLTQQQVEAGLHKFGAKAVVVGHTLQSQVSKYFDGKVYAIDVAHPNDDHKLWPAGKSEALFIDGNKYYRVSANGKKLEI